MSSSEVYKLQYLKLPVSVTFSSLYKVEIVWFHLWTLKTNQKQVKLQTRAGSHFLASLLNDPCVSSPLLIELCVLVLHDVAHSYVTAPAAATWAFPNVKPHRPCGPWAQTKSQWCFFFSHIQVYQLISFDLFIVGKPMEMKCNFLFHMKVSGSGRARTAVPRTATRRLAPRSPYTHYVECFNNVPIQDSCMGASIQHWCVEL